jgi:hypothetical protein
MLRRCLEGKGERGVKAACGGGGGDAIGDKY